VFETELAHTLGLPNRSTPVHCAIHRGNSFPLLCGQRSLFSGQTNNIQQNHKTNMETTIQEQPLRQVSPSLRRMPSPSESMGMPSPTETMELIMNTVPEARSPSGSSDARLQARNRMMRSPSASETSKVTPHALSPSASGEARAHVAGRMMRTQSASETMEIVSASPDGLSPSQARGRVPSGTRKGSGGSSEASKSTEKLKRVNRIRLMARGLLTVSGIVLFILVTVQLTQIRSFMNKALHQKAEHELHLMGFRFREQLINAKTSLAALSVDSSISDYLLGNVTFKQEVDRMLADQSRYASVSVVMLLDKDKKILSSSGAALLGQVYDPRGIVSEVFSAGYITDPLYVSAAISATDFFSLNGTEFVDGEWSLMARQSLATTGQKVGLAQYVVLPLFSSQQEIIGALVTVNLLNGNLEMVQDLMSVFDDGFTGVYVVENGTVYPVAHAHYQDDHELNLHYNIPTDEITSIASAILAESTVDLTPQTRSYITSEYGTLFLSYLRTEGWERNGQISSTHRGQTVLVRGIYANQLDSDFTSLRGVIISVSVSFLVFYILAMFAAIHNFVNPLEKLVYYVSKGKLDRYQDILPKIMSRKRFALISGGVLLIASGFLVSIVPLSSASVSEVADKLTETKDEFQGLLYSYSSKMRTLVSSLFFVDVSLTVLSDCRR
jgi:hypothetical protein